MAFDRDWNDFLGYMVWQYNESQAEEEDTDDEEEEEEDNSYYPF